MHRAVTAIYRSRAVATLVRDELERLAIARHAIVVVPNSNRKTKPTAPRMRGAAVGTAGGAFVAGAPFSGVAFPIETNVDTDYASGIYADAFDRLHDLHLPQDDTRIYQQAIRNGDTIVSVEVDENVDIVRVQEIMRRPDDAHNLDELSHRYSSAPFAPRRRPLGENYDERWAGRYDQTHSSSHTRTYVREAALTSS